MAIDLAQLIDRLARGLMDPSRLVWGDAVLEEACRLALAEYNQALGAHATLAGLDGAALTSLPAAHESLLALGAAAHATAMRLAGKLEDFPPLPAREGLAIWSDLRREAFLQGLAAVRAGDLHAATCPWAQPGWKLDAWEER